MTQQEEHRLAKKYGFKCSLDPRRGGNWARFFKENFHVRAMMFNGHQAWQVILFVGNYFLGYTIKSSLEDAFKLGENMKELKVEKWGPARYYIQEQGWEFTIDYHHGTKKWYSEAIKGGRNRWGLWFHNAGDEYSCTLNEALSKVLFFIHRELQGSYSLKDPTAEDTQTDTTAVVETPQSNVPVKEETECGCGAGHTSTPNKHYSYCPLFKK